MTHRRPAFATALVVLAVAILACNAPTASPALRNPPPTVTPYVAGTPPAEIIPTETQPAATTTQPEATTETQPEAMATPLPTETPTPTATPPPATASPTATRRPVSEGPLDFAPPTWVHAWEQQADGSIKITLRVTITGGAPPFTISHDGVVDGRTWERDYYLQFVRQGCVGIVHNITVQSGDGQTATKDYWIGVEQQPWCPH